jgi:dipeptidyl aminopeptidase/acylaminoacyl peptidase
MPHRKYNCIPSIAKIAAGLLAGATLLTLVGPLVGETIATLPPSFPRNSAGPLEVLGLPYEEVSFASTEGIVLRGWFIPAEGANAPAILYAPATAHDQRSGLSLVPAFHQAGYHVLLFSYRGHALSDGRRGAFTYGDAESRDVDAAVRFLSETKEIGQIGVIGHSAGAVSAILSAARNPLVGAVIAVAPFTCVSDVWYTSRPKLVPAFILDWALWVAENLRGFDREDVCPLKVVDQVAPRPLLIIHGTNDQRITQEQVQSLFAAAQAPKTLWLVEGASHSQVRTPVLEAMSGDLIVFLDEALSVPRAAAAVPAGVSDPAWWDTGARAGEIPVPF